MLRGMILAGFVVAALIGSPEPGRAGVSVNIGIDLPGPPALVPVPGTAVMYAPALPANYFFYDAQYYAFAGGAWYVSAGYNGPWVTLAPEFVPRPILAVPVGYYRVLPLAWRARRRDVPPHWEPRWGRHWADHGEPARESLHARRHEERR